ncbi:hypothetical protein MG293_015897 [Ovis ammon polii]|uniref:Uncharacterized protein n=1 Tax=Ovis ammon polii TaxID=230172 RepID=A0AAD4TVH6_OVIAM|nr:hypothetical protein MG293_015897 [Ovis ammon polii]
MMLPLSTIGGQGREEVQTRPPQRRGSTCGAMMLPLSTIEGQETEEVQTRPPEKGVLLSVKADVPRKKSKRMKGTVSFRVLPFCPVVPWTSEPALPGPPGQAVSKPARSSPDAQTEPGAGGSSGAMMLPLSTIEGQETEEVQTRPPEKGALLSENPDEPRKKPRGMKGRLSFNVLPFCPMPSVCFTYYVEPDDPEPEPQVAPDASKSDPNCSFVPLPVLEFREVKEAVTMHRGLGGSTCGVTMLPLSTIEAQEPEEVQTKPPKKGGFFSKKKPDVLPKKSKKMKGTVSFRVLPFCPVEQAQKCP